MSASTPSQASGRSPQTSSGLSVEMIRTMRDSGVVSALTQALKLIDMDHPQAPRAINSIIKPLEVLTRTVPAPVKKAAASAAATAVRPVAPAVVDQVQCYALLDVARVAEVDLEV